MSKAIAQVFHAAPFAFDGELLGVGAWQVSALSPRWVEFGREVLRTGGSAFHGPLPSPFERVGLCFTSVSGPALATFSLDGVPVASSAYLRGDDLTAERQLLEMFLESVRRVDIVRKTQRTSQPFVEVFSIAERPLHVVISWGVSEGDDGSMIAELGTHFAAAFFYGRGNGQ